MTIAPILICPGETGYEFSPSLRDVDSCLLKLLRPTASELQDSGLIVPLLRASWLESGWLTPKKTVVTMAGLRAKLPASSIQRGSGSVWAVAATTSVRRTPSAAALTPDIVALVEVLDSAVLDADENTRFANDTHLELRAIGWRALKAAIERLRGIAVSGHPLGPFK